MIINLLDPKALEDLDCCSRVCKVKKMLFTEKNIVMNIIEYKAMLPYVV